jgi:hypothetical protein
MKPKNVQLHYRQGDVLIERIDSLPSKLMPVARESGRVVLAHGEVTGHAHAIANKSVAHFTSPSEKVEPGLVGVTYLEVRAAVAALKHEEHSTIELPAGSYRVTRQREYSPLALRNVSD